MNGFPEGWIIKLPRCLPAKKFPTSASGRQDRGPVTLLGFRRSFHLTGVDPTVVSPAAILKQEHSFLIPNLKAGISVVKSAWRQGHTGSVLFGRQLAEPRLVNVERRPSFRLPSASRFTDYCRICLGAPLEDYIGDNLPLRPRKDGNLVEIVL